MTCDATTVGLGEAWRLAYVACANADVATSAAAGAAEDAAGAPLALLAGAWERAAAREGPPPSARGGDWLARAFWRLPAPHRGALWLAEVMGMNDADTGTVLGTSAGGARALLRRARSAVANIQGAPGCPPAKRLSRYLRGDLPAQEADKIDAHVNSCSRCQARCTNVERSANLAANLDALVAEAPPGVAPAAEAGVAWLAADGDEEARFAAFFADEQPGQPGERQGEPERASEQYPLGEQYVSGQQFVLGEPYPVGEQQAVGEPYPVGEQEAVGEQEPVGEQQEPSGEQEEEQPPTAETPVVAVVGTRKPSGWVAACVFGVLAAGIFGAAVVHPGHGRAHAVSRVRDTAPAQTTTTQPIVPVATTPGSLPALLVPPAPASTTTTMPLSLLLPPATAAATPAPAALQYTAPAAFQPVPQAPAAPPPAATTTTTPSRAATTTTVAPKRTTTTTRPPRSTTTAPTILPGITLPKL